MRRLKPSAVLGALGLAACLCSPARAWAAWPQLTSSMGVQCISATPEARCDALRFALQVSGENRLRFLRIEHPIPSVFMFRAVTAIQDAFGNLMNWSSGRWTDTELSLEFLDAAGAAAYEPVYATVSLRSTSTGTAADLNSNKFSYYAKGYMGETGTEIFETTGTTTTPEPVSMVLLGSGLAGVAGVARRRRKVQQQV